MVMPDSGWGSRRNVAPYLGATIVIVLGFGGILLTAMMIFPQATMQTVVACSLGLTLVLALFWGLTPGSELPSAIYGWVNNRKSDSDELQGYEPLTKKTKRMKTGPHAPPSVEEVREIKENSNNWVPTSGKRIVPSRRLGPTGWQSQASEQSQASGPEA